MPQHPLGITPEHTTARLALGPSVNLDAALARSTATAKHKATVTLSRVTRESMTGPRNGNSWTPNGVRQQRIPQSRVCGTHADHAMPLSGGSCCQSKATPMSRGIGQHHPAKGQPSLTRPEHQTALR
jgi:hypothetical protein